MICHPFFLPRTVAIFQFDCFHGGHVRQSNLYRGADPKNTKLRKIKTPHRRSQGGRQKRVEVVKEGS